MLNLEKIAYKGWPNCLRLSNGLVELIVTTDVGPRIIHFGWAGSDKNLFYVADKTAGKTGGDTWHLYGGHRLWHAPEIKPRTYVPDNEPVKYSWDGHCLRLQPDTETLTGIRKTTEIVLDDSNSSLTLHHQLTNEGQWEITCAPWALSVMAGGGTAIMPQEPFIKFPDALLPARPLVLWHYTNMADARFTWAKDYVGLKHDAKCTGPAKFGVRNSVGWGAYVLGDTAFIKRSDLKPEAEYPDFGCNWELYTDNNFLELETLGPLALIPVGKTVEHVEQWSLAKVDAGLPIDALYTAVNRAATSH